MRLERAVLVSLCGSVVILSSLAPALPAQTFVSGSSGNDRAYDLTGQSGTVVFDPVAMGLRTRAPQDDKLPNVFHFTSITIPAGVTVRISNAEVAAPVFWLAQGAVDIRGIVDLNGAPGHVRTKTTVDRKPSRPGAGGYDGGLGGNHRGDSKGAAGPGLGPGGGAGAPRPSDDRGFGAELRVNPFVVPALGGSGGGGGSSGEFEWWGAGGGAGGGALTIASSVSITVTGQIQANGGRGGTGSGGGGCAGYGSAGGGGGGGAIRLVAPVISGSGSLSAGGGAGGGTNGGYNCGKEGTGESGRVRLDAYQHQWTFSISANYTSGSPLSSFAPTGPPSSLRVVFVGEEPVVDAPSGSFELPDVTIERSSPTTVEIEATQVPVGTAVTLHLSSLEAADQHVETRCPGPTPTTPCCHVLDTALKSTCTGITFPPGFTRGFARAVWQ
jgi:hypothetical protein